MTIATIFSNYITFVGDLPVSIIQDAYSTFDAIYQFKVSNVANINSLIHSTTAIADNVVNNMVPGPDDLNRALSKVYGSQEEVKSTYKLIKEAGRDVTNKILLIQQLQSNVTTHLINLQDLNQTSFGIIENIKNLNN